MVNPLNESLVESQGAGRLADGLGFVGAGAMAEALIKGVIRRGLIAPEKILAYDIRSDHVAQLAATLHIRAASGPGEVAGAKTLILAVKPQQMDAALDAIAPHLTSESLVVSIAAGIPTRHIEECVRAKVPVVRVMPNTPCLVGEAATALSLGQYANEAHERTVLHLFRSVGEATTLPESLMDAVTGLSGSGPAYVCLVIEALADGGVAAGLPRDVAQRLAAQTVLGAAMWVKDGLKAGEHPAALRDRVTSPAGTTAAGLGILEAGAVRSAFARAVEAASQRAGELGS